MKKNSIIVGLIGIVLICIITTGCIFYNVLDSKEFKSHFEDLGYSISSEEDTEYNSTSHYIAKKDDVSYSIEYFEFKDEIEAKKAYQSFKNNLVNYITSTSNNKITTGAVFTKLVAVSEKEYIVISRVKNTLIFNNGTKAKEW